MSEETHNAATLGPMAINTAVAASGVLGWLLTVTFCFCLGELEATLQSPTGMAVAQILLNAAGTRGATLMWALVVLVQLFTGVSAMLACTRMAYAFARDGALPFSPYAPPSSPSSSSSPSPSSSSPSSSSSSPAPPPPTPPLSLLPFPRAVGARLIARKATGARWTGTRTRRCAACGW